MRLITRLIASEWFKAFIGSFLVLFLVTSAADILSGFLRGKDAEYVFTYYLIKMPDFLSKILPASCLVATLFSLNNLKNHSELIAILATGFSTKKVIAIILFLSSAVSVFQFINVAYIMPSSSKLQQEFEERIETSKLKKVGINASSLDNGRIWYKSNAYFASFTGFDRQKKELKELSLYFYSKKFKGSKIIHAKSATYFKDSLWTFKDGISYSKLESSEFPEPNHFKEITLPLNEVPEDFSKFESKVKTLNLFSLSRFIDRMEKTGINVREYKIIYFEKIALSFVCIIFSLVSLTTLYNPNRRSGSFAKSVVFTLMFSLVF